MSKSCSEPMIDRNTQIRMVGPSSGSVIVPLGLPPAGAVDRGGLVQLLGNALQAGEEQDDRETEVLPGQDDDAASRARTSGSASQPCTRPPRPTASQQASTRRRGCRISSHMMPAMTSASTYGTKMSVRRTPWPRKLRLSSRAMARPSGQLDQRATPTTMISVVRSASMKTGR